MRVLIICNPISGGGRSRRLGSRLGKLLEDKGHRVDLYFTERAGDASRRAAEVDGDVERIVAVGGDGTLNEVLNGLPDPSRIPMTQLATGTANLLAHDLGLPYDSEGAIRVLERGAVRRLDMGMIGDKRFLMVVSSGFDAMVTHEVHGNRTGTMSYARWLPSIVKLLKDYHPPRLTVEVDECGPVEGEMVIVSNVRTYAGLFTVADRARCDSGHLDVCVLTRASFPHLARATVGGLTGGLSQLKGVVYLTGTRIALTAREPVAVQLDGEAFGTTPLEITLKPGHVPVVVPPS